MRTAMISLFAILLALQLYSVSVWGRVWLRERSPLALALVVVSGSFIALAAIRTVEEYTGLNLRPLSWVIFLGFSATHFALAAGWITRSGWLRKGNETKDVESRGNEP